MNFIIKRDAKDIFRFASLQSEEAKKITKKFNFDNSSLNTFILVADEKLFTKSTAALLVSKELKSPAKIIFPLIILPKFFRDFVYDMIAKNRYRIFGKRDTCRIPTEEEKRKFL